MYAPSVPQQSVYAGAAIAAAKKKGAGAAAAARQPPADLTTILGMESSIEDELSQLDSRLSMHMKRLGDPRAAAAAGAASGYAQAQKQQPWRDRATPARATALAHHPSMPALPQEPHLVGARQAGPRSADALSRQGALAAQTRAKAAAVEEQQHAMNAAAAHKHLALMQRKTARQQRFLGPQSQPV
jgi:hypothetical protein